MLRFLVRAVIFCALGLCAMVGTAQDADRWVTDRFEITLRTGKGTQQAIVRMLASGTRLELLEDDPESGYARVRTRGGAEGWVLRRYLLNSPPALVTLPGIQTRQQAGERRVRELEQALQESSQARVQLEQQIGQLEGSGAELQTELTEIRRLSANVIQIEEQNKDLRKRLVARERQVTDLETENRRLASRSNREWFVVGAAVLIAGMLLGLILPRIRWRRKSRWSDF